MKLYNLLKNSDNEITVWDKNYDVEVYFYGIFRNKDNLDDWDKAMVELSKLLVVVNYSPEGVTVNLSDVIEKNLQNLANADLFICCTLDAIMADIHSILAGYVSEEWLQRFVSVLKGK